MKNITPEKIAPVCNGKLCCMKQSGETDREATCVVLDSRKIQPGGIFIANCGEHTDGHKYIGQVFAEGALCVITEKTPKEVYEEYQIPTDAWGTYILVEDSLQALKDVAEYYRKQLEIPVIGITGSVGKTSTKEFIATVLARKYNVLKTEGNFNNEIGLPLTLLRIRKEHEVAVVEMGISDFGEMHRLSKMARPNICVLTNIGQCHLENLKSREGILKAKTEIFDFMADDGFVCVNGNDDLLATLDKVNGRKVLRYGIVREGCECFDSDFDVYADKIENCGLLGSKACLHMGIQGMEIQIPLPGMHMVANATAAALVAGILDVSFRHICDGIASVEAVGGRSHLIVQEDRTIIDDCYNANPVSMKAALDMLMMAKGRKVALLGDMFELGENTAAMHKEVGVYAAKAGTDVIVCVGENAKHMQEGAGEYKSDKQELLYFTTPEELLRHLSGILQKQDTILVKASHGMGFSVIVEALEK